MVTDVTSDRFIARSSLSVESGAGFAYICEGRINRSTPACAECQGSLLRPQDGTMSAKDFEILRQHMLVEISAGTSYVSDVIGKAALGERVMAAMGKVPRHEFVPVELQPYAYANIPLPIGFEKTISQPFIVALMTDLLDIGANDTVLEIGTGLGYQAAILAQLARKVYSIEIIEELARQAKQRLRQQGCTNTELKTANGYHGWSEHAPFDKVIVTAAPDLIPPPLIHQLKAGGKMVIPAGLPDAQQLVLVEKNGNGKGTTKEILQVRFSQPEETEPGSRPTDVTEKRAPDARIHRRHKHRWQTRERDGGGGGRADRRAQGEVRAAGRADQLRAAAQQARRSASSPRPDCRQGQVIGRVIAHRAHWMTADDRKHQCHHPRHPRHGARGPLLSHAGI